MADESKDAGKPDDSPGVFGNLPSTRPGSRSPRRDSGKKSTKATANIAKTAKPKASAQSKAKAAPSAPKPASPPPPPPPPDTPPPPPPSDGKAPPASIKSVEDLAWAGVTVAAQAATIGVRFASRALDAARKSIDRP